MVGDLRFYVRWSSPADLHEMGAQIMRSVVPSLRQSKYEIVDRAADELLLRRARPDLTQRGFIRQAELRIVMTDGGDHTNAEAYGEAPQLCPPGDRPTRELSLQLRWDQLWLTSNVLLFDELTFCRPGVNAPLRGRRAASARQARAVRWAGRLALEVPDLRMIELAGVLESLGALPDEHAQRTLLALAERPRKPRQPAAAAPPPTRSSQRRRGRFP
jgi:hypothetical protein